MTPSMELALFTAAAHWVDTFLAVSSCTLDLFSYRTKQAPETEEVFVSVNHKASQSLEEFENCIYAGHNLVLQ